MKEYSTEQVRNVAFLGHSGSGKSTLSEALLFRHKHIERMGKTEDGNLTADYDPEEVKRRMSINTSLLPVELKEGIKLNILDCPGSRDFIGEITASVRVSEGVVVFVDAGAGVQVGTEFAFEYARMYGLPAMAFVNKLDKENTDFEKTLAAIGAVAGTKAVALAYPIGKQSGLKGVVDLTHMQAMEETLAGATPVDIPADIKGTVDALREQLVEAAAEGEDTLMEKYFEDGALSDEEVIRGMKKAFHNCAFVPVFCGSASLGIGLSTLCDFMRTDFPTPLEMPGLPVQDGDGQRPMAVDPKAPFAAFVFKTVSDDFAGRLNFFKVIGGSFSPATAIQNHTQNKSEKVAHVLVPRGKKQEEVAHINAGDIGVVAKLSTTFTNDSLGDPKHPVMFAPTVYPQRTSIVAIQAKNTKDEDKVGVALHSIGEQDPTLHVERDAEVHQTLLSGMGDQHVDVAVERLRAKSKVEIELVQQKIRYRETITKKAEGSFRHKKQSGGRGQFAEVYIRLSPLADKDYEFKWSVFGGSIPTNFQGAVDKGAQMGIEKGFQAGYRAVGVLVDCFDGKHHPVDSSDMAFQIAASQCVKQVAQQAGPILLEPICVVTVTVPDSYMGDVMGDISQRRGKIQGTENKAGKAIVKASVPEAEMLTYAQNLRSITGGRGTFERSFAHYDPVPREIQQKIIDDHKTVEEEA